MCGSMGSILASGATGFCYYEHGVFSLSSHQSESLLGHPWVTCAVVYAWVLHLVAKSCDGFGRFSFDVGWF